MVGTSNLSSCCMAIDYIDILHASLHGWLQNPPTNESQRCETLKPTQTPLWFYPRTSIVDSRFIGKPLGNINMIIVALYIYNSKCMSMIPIYTDNNDSCNASRYIKVPKQLGLNLWSQLQTPLVALKASRHAFIFAARVSHARRRLEGMQGPLVDSGRSSRGNRKK